MLRREKLSDCLLTETGEKSIQNNRKWRNYREEQGAATFSGLYSDGKRKCLQTNENWRVYCKLENHYLNSNQPWKQKFKVGKFVHKPFFLHFQFHSSYSWLFCPTQSFLINHLSLHFNKTCFLPLEIFLIFLKRSGQRHSNFWLVWVQQEAYPGQCQTYTIPVGFPAW